MDVILDFFQKIFSFFSIAPNNLTNAILFLALAALLITAIAKGARGLMTIAITIVGIYLGLCVIQAFGILDVQAFLGNLGSAFSLVWNSIMSFFAAAKA